MAQKQQDKKAARPAQKQRTQPGLESLMKPAPRSAPWSKAAARKLAGRVAVITGGDSGIGRAVALAFAEEGADIAIVYLNEHEDAATTASLVAERDQRCECYPADVGFEANCQDVVARIVRDFGRLDILVNNAAEQHPQKSIADISTEQLERTFRTNIFSFFFMVKASLPHLKRGAAIINTSSVTAYRGSAELLDYSATKGAIVTFTRSLAHALVERGIRVNGVAPGPIWTPLIPASFPAAKVKTFGTDVPMGRVGQPAEVAPCFVFLASEDSSYMTGQVLHPNGGEIING